MPPVELYVKNKKFPTSLTSLLSNTLTPLLPDIQNVFIAKPKNNGEFVVTYVCANDLPPHQILKGKNKYYMRIGYSFKQIFQMFLVDDTDLL
ncbi:hypothetical protein SOM37_24725 [Bacillus thuringiensis]|uniref:hypothetical protein n=1 Tax=Bacillus thuringiensis TaxID=1428 RepID=UPI002A6A94D2|nr:hypothetical protein [Bacillus thuringiensis]MDY0952047.1 hypothetical protein [Bacillus thuringiensis]